MVLTRGLCVGLMALRMSAADRACKYVIRCSACSVQASAAYDTAVIGDADNVAFCPELMVVDMSTRTTTTSRLKSKPIEQAGCIHVSDSRLLHLRAVTETHGEHRLLARLSIEEDTMRSIRKLHEATT